MSSQHCAHWAYDKPMQTLGQPSLGWSAHPVLPRTVPKMPSALTCPSISGPELPRSMDSRSVRPLPPQTWRLSRSGRGPCHSRGFVRTCRDAAEAHICSRDRGRGSQLKTHTSGARALCKAWSGDTVHCRSSETTDSSTHAAVLRCSYGCGF